MREETEKVTPQRPTVLVFSAEWCGHCKEIVPKIKEMEQDSYGAQIDFVHVDTDNATQALLDQFNVDELPSMHVWRNPDWEHTDFQGVKAYCAENYWVRGTDYFTRSDVEKLCKDHKRDMKDFDKFMLGQGAPMCSWEDEQYCYWCSDVNRFLGY